MPYPLNLAATSDVYTDACTMTKTPPGPSMSVVVSTAAVYYSFSATTGLRDSDQFGADTYIPPGRYYFDEKDLPAGTDGFSKIRFRSAVIGKPGIVNAS